MPEFSNWNLSAKLTKWAFSYVFIMPAFEMSAQDFLSLDSQTTSSQVSELTSEVCIPAKDKGNLVPL